MSAIKEWLDAAGWSQSKLAERAGLSPAAISRFISGTRVVGWPFAVAIEQVTTDAYRLGEVSVAPLRANDLSVKKAKKSKAKASTTVAGEG